MTEVDRPVATAEAIHAALNATGIRTVQEPRDGDCLVWEPVITEILRMSGFAAARRAFVLGWGIALDQEVIVFTHMTTEVDGLIVDFTAHQFYLLHPVPQRWVAPARPYAVELAVATGVGRVSILPPQFRTWTESIV